MWFFQWPMCSWLMCLWVALFHQTWCCVLMLCVMTPKSLLLCSTGRSWTQVNWTSTSTQRSAPTPAAALRSTWWGPKCPSAATSLLIWFLPPPHQLIVGPTGSGIVQGSFWSQTQIRMFRLLRFIIKERWSNDNFRRKHAAYLLL